MTQIAISYRRDDSKAASHMLFEQLKTVFGRQSVFLDFDSIGPGVDFRNHIDNTLQRCNVVLVMIGPRWLGAQSDGTQRIDSAEDWVRIEIETAFRHKVFVIPVLVDGTPMPSPQQMPQSIRELAFLNAVTLDTGIDFGPHCERLVKAITHRFPMSADRDANEPVVGAVAGSRKRPSWLIAGGAAGCVIIGLIVYLFSSAAPPLVAASLHDVVWYAAQGDSANKAGNYDTALQWYRKAAEKGNVHAKTQIGLYYQLGRGVDEDAAKAFQWTKEAANEGDVHGMHNLAELYFFGIGTSRNNVQAAVWYRKAADLGDAASENALGLAYEDGFGLPKDEALALQWFQKAANDGDLDAEEKLGEMYAAGEGGVPKDLRVARYWMIKAAERGHTDAKAWLQDNPGPSDPSPKN